MKGQRLILALTAANVAILLVVLVQARSGEPQPVGEGTTLRGQALELVDEDGRVRTRLNVEPSGEVVLRMLDERGQIRVKLGTAADGSGLVLLDNETQPGVQVLAARDGPALTLTGRDGQTLRLTP